MPMDWQGLTEREFEILGLIARGRSVEQAARELGVSVNTVKTHLKAIYSKLDTHTRVTRRRGIGAISPKAGDVRLLSAR